MNWHQFIFNIFHLDDDWLNLGKVAKYEGNTTDVHYNTPLDQCKEKCNLNPNCKSFAFAEKLDGGRCYLKDKCIVPNEPTKDEPPEFITYFKICGEIVNIL